MSITEDKASLKETKLSKLIYFTKKKLKWKFSLKRHRLAQISSTWSIKHFCHRFVFILVKLSCLFKSYTFGMWLALDKTTLQNGMAGTITKISNNIVSPLIQAFYISSQFWYFGFTVFKMLIGLTFCWKKLCVIVQIFYKIFFIN